MVLSSIKVAKLIATGQWHAYENERELSYEELDFGEHSVDVRLGRNFGIVRGVQFEAIDIHNTQSLQYQPFTADEVLVSHGELLLATVTQRFDCSAPVEVFRNEQPIHFTQSYDGRSTVARLGITSHQSAGYADYGYESSFTLEIANCSETPILLHAGMRIGQISFVPVLCHESSRDYRLRGAYNQQHDRPGPPIIGRNRF